MDDAHRRWPRADEAWEAVTWVLARDPHSAGSPIINEKGDVRTFVFEGARSIGMPTVRVVYKIQPDKVVIHDAVFEEAAHQYAGRA